MTKEMVISANRHETKVAVLEDDLLCEVYFQRANEYSLAGSIHKGRVTRVLPGMQSAFVDLGLERDTFLYVSDFFEENEEYDQIAPEKESRTSREQRPPRDARPPREEAPREERPEAVALPEAAPSVETGIEALSAVASAPPQESVPQADRQGRPDRGGDQDRHRRSRRRRNRGRGFPESKYASPTAEPAPSKPVEDAVAVAENVPVASSTEEFPVLPGESLAKYRHPETLDRDQQDEPAAEEIEQTAGEVAPDEIEEQTPSVAHQSEIPVSSPEAAAPAEPELSEVPKLPVLSPAEEEEIGELLADARAEAAERAKAIEQEETEPTAKLDASPVVTPIQTDEPADTEAVPEREDEPEITETEAEADVDADVETEGEIEGEVPALEQVGSVVTAGETGAHAEQTAEVLNAPPSEAATAAVRDQGGRYMQHRVSRRMRRKMRSQGRGPEGEQKRESDPKREGETLAVAAPEPAARPEPRPVRQEPPRPERTANTLITDLLKEGQEILVQIAKEPLGQKGARITSHIALPGRYVVFMPTLEHMGVSRKIASDEERLRLKRILQAHRSGIQGGFIVRTAGEGKSEDEIASDMSFLSNLWLDIRQKAEKRPAPALLHHDLDIVQRLLRDQFTENFKAIWVDNEEVYESILRFVQRFQPSLVTRVKLYTRPAPIFDAFNITAELEKALRPKVWLKSGGYIVINQTEALVAVDVNTGKFVGKSNRLEDTIVKTNTEAVKEIVRQIRLRDLGGIIVVDFIDMDERKNRQKVMQALEEAMRADKAPYKILQFNDFGLVAITRKRVKQSLERALCSPCAYCEGAGYVKSVQTIIGEILQEAQKIVAAVEGENVILRVNPEVAKTLKSTQNHYLEELESILRRPVLIKGDPLLHHEKFDLA